MIKWPGWWTKWLGWLSLFLTLMVMNTHGLTWVLLIKVFFKNCNWVNLLLSTFPHFISALYIGVYRAVERKQEIQSTPAQIIWGPRALLQLSYNILQPRLFLETNFFQNKIFLTKGPLEIFCTWARKFSQRLWEWVCEVKKNWFCTKNVVELRFFNS